MALLRWLQPRIGLPDPRGSLLSSVPSQAIAAANREVKEAIRTASSGKRGLYGQYSPTVRAEIGKYACNHGVAAAVRYFSRKRDKPLNESTVQSIKKAYVEGIRRKREAEDGGDIRVLPLKKRGWPVLLGQELDMKDQLSLKKIRDGRGAVSVRIAMAAARGILLKCDRTQLAEFGGPVQLNRYWAHSLLKRMKFVKRKATTAKSKLQQILPS